jgi:hypothetical protein
MNGEESVWERAERASARGSAGKLAATTRAHAHVALESGVQTAAVTAFDVCREPRVRPRRRVHHGHAGGEMRTNNLVLLLLLLIAPGALADELAVAAGAFDVRHGSHSAELRLEWESAEHWAGLYPILGGMATTRGALWGGVGLALPIQLGSAWMVAPSGSLGLYSRGNDKRLGATLEFRPAIELAYRFDAGSVGLVFSHYSNAGLGNRNPGAESLLLRWAWRL